jgi:hypothetical protein
MTFMRGGLVVVVDYFRLRVLLREVFVLALEEVVMRGGGIAWDGFLWEVWVVRG